MFNFGNTPGGDKPPDLLETYRVTIGEGSTLVIPLSSPFAKYLLGVENLSTAPPSAAGD